ncbi:hypothetical protein ACFYWN_15215 [Streptomyces sp. NPDC002917]|uniref:hypothetical protein n=1 Tax=unclassified Streptomyces TaxID=2593676 RepID=UPI002E800E5C|nr:hypothetical protein [Streptomyces sp. NBC_00562]WTC83660.1 hypothetical protein OH719_40770 [Streptomyces sp. NBC_01653]WTD87204.1 hypothetical protein OG891_06095 [Streptomyces sp. NBC_01637]WUC18293.1 hypothetical protein OHA33_05175 [Streptomyces sp. NBC_00562]
MADDDQAERGRAVRVSSSAAVVAIAVPAVLVAGTLALFGLDALDGAIQVALAMCAIAAALVAMKKGHSRSAVQRAGQGALSYPPYAVFDYPIPALSVLHGITGFEIEKTVPVMAGPTAH